MRYNIFLLLLLAISFIYEVSAQTSVSPSTSGISSSFLCSGSFLSINEKGSLIKGDSAKINRPYKNVITLDVLQLGQGQMTLSYERKLKAKRLALRVPFRLGSTEIRSFGYIVSSGVQMKVFLNKSSIIKGYIGPEIIGGLETTLEYRYSTFYNEYVWINGNNGFIGFLPVMGLAVQPYNRLFFDVEAGAGLAYRIKPYSGDHLLIPWRISLNMGLRF